MFGLKNEVTNDMKESELGIKLMDTHKIRNKEAMDGMQGGSSFIVVDLYQELTAALKQTMGKFDKLNMKKAYSLVQGKTSKP